MPIPTGARAFPGPAIEIEDRELDLGEDRPAPDEGVLREQRRVYFRELFRLQGELVKLQDWVAATRHKVVILFEGRDAAGKGGVIKRITQRLNPRICRQPAKWCCSTAAGTTAPASSA
jgi:polyphosphate kinase 2 (PPK2 family)